MHESTPARLFRENRIKNNDLWKIRPIFAGSRDFCAQVTRMKPETGGRPGLAGGPAGRRDSYHVRAGPSRARHDRDPIASDAGNDYAARS
jgi:hypothetical protein